MVIIVIKSSNYKRPDNNILLFCFQNLFQKSQQEKCYWPWKGNIWLYLAAASVLFFEINCKLSIEKNSIYRKKCLLFLIFFLIFFVFLLKLQLLCIGPFGEASVTVYLFSVPAQTYWLMSFSYRAHSAWAVPLQSKLAKKGIKESIYTNILVIRAVSLNWVLWECEYSSIHLMGYWKK